MRNRRQLNASLKGSTLGDADGDDDTLKWVKRSKKKEKELARKRLEEQENMDKMFQGEEYSERAYHVFQSSFVTHVLQGDLVGLKVSHDFDDMGDGEERILTLKDSRILDNEGTFSFLSVYSIAHQLTEDELHNVEMAEHEAAKKRHELKIKKKDYTGYDDDEFVEGKEGMKRSVLAKYDEELEGGQETVSIRLVFAIIVFTLGRVSV